MLGASCCGRDEFAAAADLVAVIGPGRHPGQPPLPLEARGHASAQLDEHPQETVKVLIDVRRERR